MKTTAILIFLVLASLNFSCSKKEDKSQPEFKSQAAPAQVNDLPSMTWSLLDGSQVQSKTLTSSTIIVLFLPDCDHCQREAKAIQENMKAFKNYSIYFVSSATTTELEIFARQYKLNNFDNVHFATTDVQSIFDNFGAVETPSLYVYNNTGKLMSKFNGETDIALVLKSI